MAGHSALDTRLEIVGPFAPQWGNRLSLTNPDGTFVDEEATTTASHVLQAREFADVVRHEIAVRAPARDAVANMQAPDEVYCAAGLRLRGATHQLPHQAGPRNPVVLSSALILSACGGG